jgi:hypothetical protein
MAENKKKAVRKSEMKVLSHFNSVVTVQQNTLLQLWVHSKLGFPHLMSYLHV